MYEKKRAAGPSCPLCEKPNQCGIAIGAPSCWCMRTEVPASLLERVPGPLRGVVCVCEDCVREELARVTAGDDA
ncbi:MAG: cysteine-rich CWC family protein [Myxococcota bacterium]